MAVDGEDDKLDDTLGSEEGLGVTVVLADITDGTALAEGVGASEVEIVGLREVDCIGDRLAEVV